MHKLFMGREAANYDNSNLSETSLKSSSRKLVTLGIVYFTTILRATKTTLCM